MPEVVSFKQKETVEYLALKITRVGGKIVRITDLDNDSLERVQQQCRDILWGLSRTGEGDTLGAMVMIDTDGSIRTRFDEECVETAEQKDWLRRRMAKAAEMMVADA